MRRIGTISAAIGFIFLGVWMIIERSDTALADTMFKWWPMIIIVLGIEVLVSFTKEKTETKKVGFNGLIILVIIAFMFVNSFHGIFDSFGVWNGRGFHFSFGRFVNSGFNFNTANLKEIKTTKSVNAIGNAFEFRAEDAVINIHKSTDKKIKVDAKVYVDNDDSRDKYELNFSENSDGYTVEIDEEYVGQVNADIYIPDGFRLIIDTNSSDIKSDDKLETAVYEINADSSSIDLDGGKALKLNINSGTMKLNDINEVKINGDSGKVNIEGNTEIVETVLDSGTFSLDNEVCKNIKVDMDSGTIDINTKDKNITAETELDSGTSTINGDIHINSGDSKIIGTGAGKINATVSSGTIKISSQE